MNQPVVNILIHVLSIIFVNITKRGTVHSENSVAKNTYTEY